MVLLLYISTLEGGGAARVMVNLANRFARDGETVYLVTNSGKESVYSVDDKVYRLVIDQKKYTNQISRNLIRINKLRRIIKAIKPSVVLSFMTENNIRCIISSIGLSTKTIVSVRSDPKRECGTGFRGFIIRQLYSFANGVVCQTPAALSWFNKYTQKKGIVILNQVDDSFYIQEIANNNKKNIITAGRFVEAKNHKMLIKAYAAIANEVEDDLIIYGDGDLREDYLSLVKSLEVEDRVHFPGNKTNMIDCYDQAKVFVLTSNYEGLPNVVMEAMVRGVPIISTDCPCGGPRLLLENGKYGILIDVGNEKQLSDSLISVLTNNDILMHYVEESKNRIKDFKSDKVFNEWKKFIYQMI